MAQGKKGNDKSKKIMAPVKVAAAKKSTPKKTPAKSARKK